METLIAARFVSKATIQVFALTDLFTVRWSWRWWHIHYINVSFKNDIVLKYIYNISQYNR